MLNATEVGDVRIWKGWKLCVGIDGGVMCLRWYWQHWCDGGLHVLVLGLDGGGRHLCWCDRVVGRSCSSGDGLAW